MSALTLSLGSARTLAGAAWTRDG